MFQFACAAEPTTPKPRASNSYYLLLLTVQRAKELALVTSGWNHLGPWNEFGFYLSGYGFHPGLCSSPESKAVS